MANAKALTVGLCLFLLAPAVCLAQAKKIPIAVDHTGDDSVGKGVAFALKEAIRGSRGFYLVDNDLKAPRITVILVSVDDNIGSEKGFSSAIAVAIVYDSIATAGRGIFLTLLVHDCGRDRIETCAKNILPAIDKEIENLRTNWPSLWKTL